MRLIERLTVMALTQIQLSFDQQHRSIKDLPATTLPAFCVLTGTNGSGKSHLLEAIEQGRVLVSGIVAGKNLIRRFDWITFAAQIDETANPASIRQQRDQKLQQVCQQVRAVREALPHIIKNLALAGDPQLADPYWLLGASREDLIAALLKSRRQGEPISEAQAVQFATSLIKQIHQREQAFENELRNQGSLASILAQKGETLRKPVLALSEGEIRDAMPLTWTANDTLQFQLANWFAAWHASWEYNKMNRFYATQEGERDRQYVSDDDFRMRYGPEPWDLTNEILLKAGVRFQFNRPLPSIETLEQNFDLRLVDPDDQTEIRVNELSSGERVLLAVTLLLYQSSGELGLVRLPKLLLLDEVDAPLHPSFTKILIEVLHHDLVKKCGLAVVLTTHAPSTVALSPEDSVYELIRKPRSIRKVTASEATQILSSGYVSITSSDVIVITESSADPEYYQQAYSSFVRRGDITHVPPLKFISASDKNDDGIGGGNRQVQNWAPKLHAAGLDRFRGLIDRNGGADETDVVAVLQR